MIIKSMSRQNQTFAQLMNYMNKEKTLDTFTWNLYSNRKNTQELVDEFLQNAEYLKSARGKVFLYHEILSLEKNNLSLKEQQQILSDLAHKYIQQRANENLVYGVIHNDTKNLHIHLMISANKVAQNKRVRLSKKEFKDIQKNLELYKNQAYPQLEKTTIYQQNKDRTKSKQKEQEIKHRRKKVPLKEQIKEDLEDIFLKTHTNTYLQNALKNRDYQFYTRGKYNGIIYKNKKYRLNTLGLEKDYKQALSNIKKVMERKSKRQDFKQSQQKTRDTQKSKSSSFNNGRSRWYKKRLKRNKNNFSYNRDINNKKL